MIHRAFKEICEEAQEPEDWYLCLIERRPFYGGPEEGGWWGEDNIVSSFQKYPSKELAEKARKHVEKLAEHLSAEAKKDYGEFCLREMEWLDERGLDSDYFQEPDGATEYYVEVTEGIPTDSRGCRHYE